jgi:hypothetical protein
MKSAILNLFTIASLTLTSVLAQDDSSPLPFSVTVGGQAATHKKGEPFAKLEKPVAADAEIVLGAKSDLAIINIHKAKADGSPDTSSQPAIIMLQGTHKGTLDKTLDGKKLDAGKYFFSITAGERTASIQFTIK